MNPRLSTFIPLTLVSLVLVCGCQSHAPQKSAGLGSLEIVLELQEVEEDSVRLWLDGAFIGGVSRAHPVLRIAAGPHTIRAIGTTIYSDDADRPISAKPFEQKIMILGADTHQKLVITLRPPPDV